MRIAGVVASLASRFLGDDFDGDPDRRRLAGLVTGFGFLGVIFGLAYAAFYTAIGHYLGAQILGVSCTLLAFTPLVMRSTGSVALGGHLLSFVLALGLSALCLVEGGLYGHAIAWLAVVPLCALLLVGRRGAWLWCLVSLAAAGAVAVASMNEWHPPATYRPEWHSMISAVGYAGLIAFLFGLGLIFEAGRSRAHRALKDAMGKLESTNARLAHLNREKNEFLSIAAHDLNNPLTTIITSAELLRMGRPELIDAVAGNIYASGTRMRDLVRDLLDVNAIEEGLFSTKIETHDLREIARAAVDQNAQNAVTKGSSLRLDAPAEVLVRADRSAAIQVLDNLVSNALKYSPKASEIKVCVALEDGMGRVDVLDQGPGISEEDRKKLFRKFTRLSARPTGGESSNGLGLCIVKRLVETMRGSVECLSRPGEGATFVVRLPGKESA
jgi:signal transduction histidine kinase